MKEQRKNKYQPYPAMALSDRSWPDKVITKAPLWCSVDLRDGNQALASPMGIDQKMAMFDLLVRIGFKEIEVGFPAASEVEFNFLRKLIEKDHIPCDVTLQVLTTAREEHIKRTFEAIKGVNKAIVHLYNSTSRVQREAVFKKSQNEITAIAVKGAATMKQLRDESGNSGIRFEYSPESYTGTEDSFALHICHAVMDVWKPTRLDRMIINLPATVEMFTPNIYADRIEWFHRHIKYRESVILSVHTHNDRGTAVAAAEMAIMAGADRVEGALFGNGERSGNMDIVTMALNLYTQGIETGLDFSDIDHVRKIYRECTAMDIHPRHPYAGELVYTAFSGSHQDAINKGLKANEASESERWDVPYLPIDPKDVGRNYEAVIRINSQSGKGGVAYIMESEFGYRLPRDMQPHFGKIVQKETEIKGSELAAKEIGNAFHDTYMPDSGPYCLKSFESHNATGEVSHIEAVISHEGVHFSIKSEGKGPIDAFAKGMKEEFALSFTITIYEEHELSPGSEAKAIAYMGITDKRGQTFFGAAIDENIEMATVKALVCAVCRMRM
ncbi:MAG: 2-isopropylmalate synthase [Deltaproteobacteria bacterium]|nr:2-isopropylmalate synthase [Deltaproteobacteria bacterium]